MRSSGGTALNLSDLQKVLFTKDDAEALKLRLDERFGSIDRQFGSIHGLLEQKADKRDVERLEGKLERVESRLNHLDEAVTETIFKELKPKVDSYDKDIRILKEKVGLT